MLVDQKTTLTLAMYSGITGMLAQAALLKQVASNHSDSSWNVIDESIYQTRHPAHKSAHEASSSPNSSNQHKDSHTISTTATCKELLQSTKVGNISPWVRKDSAQCTTQKREIPGRSTQPWPWNWCIINLPLEPCHKLVKPRDHPGGAECTMHHTSISKR